VDHAPQRDVSRHITCLGADPQASEDLTHDTFLRALGSQSAPFRGKVIGPSLAVVDRAASGGRQHAPPRRPALTAGDRSLAARRRTRPTKVQCVDVGDIAAVRAAIAERVEWATAKPARVPRVQERLLAGRTDEYFATAERIGPHLALQGGVAFARENLRRGEMALKRLEQRAAALSGSARDS
jgi:hypothetical protein